ncbi:MAG TPA: thioredoxin-dependent thiol peroxidase [bacterium]|nr:thioredoxin-dependent thiol peroxidase [bacterium]
MAKLEEGKPAPDFSLPSSEGREISLADFKNKKKVVLYFYPKDDTPGCTKEACDLRDAIKKVEREDAVVLGLSKDGLASHGAFIKKYKIPFTLLSDESKGTIKKYGVWKEKSLYGKKFMGVERTTVVIDKKGIVRRIFSKVKVDGHAQEILETLAGIGS